MVNAERAIAFLEDSERPVETAWAKHLAGTGDRSDLFAALTRYQNPDGGFGQGLEPDIGAPASNPFAARLAMHVLQESGGATDEPLIARLASWLEAAQDEDGCWRLPADAKDHPLAPWFAAWTFPSLNPALCLAGAATRLGIGSRRLHQRVRDLFDNMASLEELPSAEFYTVLPYVEYVPWVEVSDRDAYLTALAAAIERAATTGGYADPDHFFEHLGPADGELAQRVPVDLIASQLDLLAAEQTDDGGWPSPYAAHWRPWVTAAALATLRRFGRL